MSIPRPCGLLDACVFVTKAVHKLKGFDQSVTKTMVKYFTHCDKLISFFLFFSLQLVQLNETN